MSWGHVFVFYRLNVIISVPMTVIILTSVLQEKWLNQCFLNWTITSWFWWKMTLVFSSIVKGILLTNFHSHGQTIHLPCVSHVIYCADQHSHYLCNEWFYISLKICLLIELMFEFSMKYFHFINLCHNMYIYSFASSLPDSYYAQVYWSANNGTTSSDSKYWFTQTERDLLMEVRKRYFNSFGR